MVCGSVFFLYIPPSSLSYFIVCNDVKKLQQILEPMSFLLHLLYYLSVHFDLALLTLHKRSSLQLALKVEKSHYDSLDVSLFMSSPGFFCVWYCRHPIPIFNIHAQLCN